MEKSGKYRTVACLAVLYGEYSTVFCFDPPTQNSLYYIYVHIQNYEFKKEVGIYIRTFYQ